MTTVARINGVSIQIIEAGEKMIPIKPICEALGISHKPQIERLRVDPILSSVVTLSVTTGADGKQYEMTVIPLKYVFGWLFLIDSRNVKPEAREAVLNYQKECYNTLWAYFARHEEFLEWRDHVVEERLIVYDNARADFREAKDKVLEARELLNKARAVKEADYFANKDQLMLDFFEPGKEAADATE